MPVERDETMRYFSGCFHPPYTALHFPRLNLIWIFVAERVVAMCQDKVNGLTQKLNQSLDHKSGTFATQSTRSMIDYNN